MARGTYNPPWTAEEEATLRRSWEEGLRHQELANVIGRTAGAVMARAHLLGLTRER